MLARLWPLWGWVGPGPLPRRVFRGGCSSVERRLVGRLLARSCQYSFGSPSGGPRLRVGMERAGGGGGLGRCWVLRERAVLVWGACFFCGPSSRSNRPPWSLGAFGCLVWWVGAG